MSEDLGPGITVLKPQLVTWHLDKKNKISVQRRGFFLAADFSGTAHSFAGDNLAAAFVDLLDWTSKPDKAAQISAYICILRAQCIKDVLVTQAYSPALFEQGDLPGPELLLKFQRGELSEGQLQKPCL